MQESGLLLLPREPLFITSQEATLFCKEAEDESPFLAVFGERIRDSQHRAAPSARGARQALLTEDSTFQRVLEETMPSLNFCPYTSTAQL